MKFKNNNWKFIIFFLFFTCSNGKQILFLISIFSNLVPRYSCEIFLKTNLISNQINFYMYFDDQNKIINVSVSCFFPKKNINFTRVRARVSIKQVDELPKAPMFV